MQNPPHHLKRGGVKMPFKKKVVGEIEKIGDEFIGENIVQENVEDFIENIQTPITSEDLLIIHNIKLLDWVSLQYKESPNQSEQEYKKIHTFLLKLLNNPDVIKLIENEKPKPPIEQPENKGSFLKWKG